MLEVEYCKSESQLVVVFIKPLPSHNILNFRSKHMVLNRS